MVEDKDIVLAIFGGSLSVAALILVFLGFTLTAYTQLDGRDQKPEKKLSQLRILVWSEVATVAFGILVAALALVWLLEWGSVDVIATVFFVLVGAMVIVSAATAKILT